MGNHLFEFIRAEKLRETCVNIINISVIALGESWQKKFIPWLNNAFRIRKRIHVELFFWYFSLLANRKVKKAGRDRFARSTRCQPLLNHNTKRTNYKFKFAIIVSALRRVVCIISRLVIPPTPQISVRHFFRQFKISTLNCETKATRFSKAAKLKRVFCGWHVTRDRNENQI